MLAQSHNFGQPHFITSATPNIVINPAVVAKNANTAVATKPKPVITNGKTLNIIPPSVPSKRQGNLLHMHLLTFLSSPINVPMSKSANIPTDIPNIIQNKITGVIVIVPIPINIPNIAPNIRLIKILRQQFPNIFPTSFWYSICVGRAWGYNVSKIH